MFCERAAPRRGQPPRRYSRTTDLQCHAPLYFCVFCLSCYAIAKRHFDRQGSKNGFYRQRSFCHLCTTHRQSDVYAVAPLVGRVCILVIDRSRGARNSQRIVTDSRSRRSFSRSLFKERENFIPDRHKDERRRMSQP